MKKIIALFLVITFMGMNCATYKKGEGINLEAGQKPGAKLIVKKKDGRQVKGELIAVKQQSLLLKEYESGVDITVEVEEISVIKIVKKSKALLGAGIGLFGGIGFIIYRILSGGEEVSYDELGGWSIVVGIPAILLGGLIGGLVGLDKTIQIEGKSEAEIKKVLDDLRKKARVPDFQ